MPNLILRLALPSPLRRLFDYLAPTGVSRSALQPGVRLRVPFGRREMIGVLVEVDSQSEAPLDKLKPALELLDARPPLPAPLFKLCLWTAQYYQHSLGDTLSWALPVLLRQGEPAETRQERYWLASQGASVDDPRLARAPRQRDALKALAQHPHGVAHSLLSQLQLNRDSLQLLHEKGLVRVEVRRTQPHPKPAHWLAQPELPLNAEQRAAVNAVASGWGQFNAFLLAGVTGSGKTEVYLQLIHQCLQAGKQALVLIPEINLGPQTFDRFARRFNARIALLHSAVNDRDRLDAWLAARDGEADIIISFELLEAARWVGFLKKGGTLVVNDQKIAPMPVIMGNAQYPEDIAQKLRSLGVNLKLFDALRLAEEAGSAKATNVVLMGAVANAMDFSEEMWQKALEECVPPKFLELNRKAFALGRNQG